MNAETINRIVGEPVPFHPVSGVYRRYTPATSDGE